jgi:hypothetical protein
MQGYRVLHLIFRDDIVRHWKNYCKIMLAKTTKNIESPKNSYLTSKFK